MPENQLASLLSSLQIQSADVQDIVRTAKSGNFQIACQKHFDVTHPGHLQLSLQVPLQPLEPTLARLTSLVYQTDGSVANHPNLWYQTSVQYHRAKNGATPKTEGGMQSEQQGEVKEVKVEVKDEMEIVN